MLEKIGNFLGSNVKMVTLLSVVVGISISNSCDDNRKKPAAPLAGERGAEGPQGPPGVSVIGPPGTDGRNGKDGKDGFSSLVDAAQEGDCVRIRSGVDLNRDGKLQAKERTNDALLCVQDK